MFRCLQKEPLCVSDTIFLEAYCITIYNKVTNGLEQQWTQLKTSDHKQSTSEYQWILTERTWTPVNISRARLQTSITWVYHQWIEVQHEWMKTSKTWVNKSRAQAWTQMNLNRPWVNTNKMWLIPINANYMKNED